MLNSYLKAQIPSLYPSPSPQLVRSSSSGGLTMSGESLPLRLVNFTYRRFSR